MKRILLIEDEPGLVLTITDGLWAEGFTVTSCEDGPSGLAAALAGENDAIVLDGMLPGMDGLQVLAKLRAAGKRMPVLMLTARSQTADKVAGLRGGADDYLTKPFAMAELVARLEVMLRRTTQELQFGDVSLDLAAASVKRAERTVTLSAKEYQLLKYLVERPGEVVGREELLANVWGYGASISTRTVDVHMTWLRQKLETQASEPRFLVTVRGMGYRFTP
jgi:two-component system, OmpR family, alkaline phosphatase synthesis response regulator PhoP